MLPNHLVRLLDLLNNVIHFLDEPFSQIYPRRDTQVGEIAFKLLA